MRHKLISCAVHDYIEIACTYHFEISIEDFTDSTIQGKAITTETSKDKKEYLILGCQQVLQKIELNKIKKMTALQENPHFDSIYFQPVLMQDNTSSS